MAKLSCATQFSHALCFWFFSCLLPWLCWFSCSTTVDWHFVLDFPEYHGYECPAYFRDDWLNAFHDHKRALKLAEQHDPVARTAAQLAMEVDQGKPARRARQHGASAMAVDDDNDDDNDDDDGLGDAAEENTAAQTGRQGYDGYRFVYMGPRGSSTAVHADVFRSFSWSINLAGRKKWRFLAPEYASLMLDKCACPGCVS